MEFIINTKGNTEKWVMIGLYMSRKEYVMKKVVLGVALGMILCMFTIGCVYMIQYNGNGLGRYLCVEIDQSGWKDIDQSNSVQIYTYNLRDPYVVAFTSKKYFWKMESNQERLRLRICVNIHKAKKK